MPNNLIIPSQTIDTRGLRCPDTIIVIRKEIRKIIDGETLLIISDDPATIHDISIFCCFMEYKLLNKEIKHLPYRYLICKNHYHKNKNKLNI